jgi:hypothetical protein
MSFYRFLTHLGGSRRYIYMIHHVLFMDSTVEFSENKGQMKEIEPGTPITLFLSRTSLSSLVESIEQDYYQMDVPRFRYPTSIMLKLVAVKCFRKLSYARTIQFLTLQDCVHLDMPRDETGFRIPHPATLHHFVKYRLGTDGVKSMMNLLGTTLVKELPDAKVGIVDSTPLEASRYDKYAPFNPHYTIRMDKAHIFHLGQFPLAMVYSGGLDADSTHLPSLISVVKPMNPHLDIVKLDGGYDTFQSLADIWYHLQCRPCATPREGAVYHEDGTVDRVRHWVNKLWKKGGDIHAPLGEQLRFLYEQGREEQVGMFFRNQNLKDPVFETLLKGRGDCERVHNSIKSTVTFQIKRIRQESKELYMILNFISYQMLLVTGLVAGLDNPSIMSNLF